MSTIDAGLHDIVLNDRLPARHPRAPVTIRRVERTPTRPMNHTITSADRAVFKSLRDPQMTLRHDPYMLHELRSFLVDSVLQPEHDVPDATIRSVRERYGHLRRELELSLNVPWTGNESTGVVSLLRCHVLDVANKMAVDPGLIRPAMLPLPAFWDDMSHERGPAPVVQTFPRPELGGRSTDSAMAPRLFDAKYQVPIQHLQNIIDAGLDVIINVDPRGGPASSVPPVPSGTTNAIVQAFCQLHYKRASHQVIADWDNGVLFRLVSPSVMAFSTPFTRADNPPAILRSLPLFLALLFPSEADVSPAQSPWIALEELRALEWSLVQEARMRKFTSSRSGDPQPTLPSPLPDIGSLRMRETKVSLSASPRIADKLHVKHQIWGQHFIDFKRLRNMDFRLFIPPAARVATDAVGATHYVTMPPTGEDSPPSSPRTLNVELTEFLSQGALCDAFLARTFGSITPMCTFALKILITETFESRFFPDEEGSEEEDIPITSQEAIEAFCRESRFYLYKLSSAQGKAVPHFFGLFSATIPHLPLASIWFALYELLDPIDWTEPEQRPTLQAVEQAFSHVHDCGIVHGDIELRHVMRVPGTKEIRIIDFDHAREGDAADFAAEMRQVKRLFGDVDRYLRQT